MYTFNRPKAKRKSRVETLHASCIVHRIHRRWNLDTLPHLQSVGPERGRGGAALRMVSRRGHRIELGSRPGSGGLESGVDLLSDGCLFRCGPYPRNLRIPLALRYPGSRRSRVRDLGWSYLRSYTPGVVVRAAEEQPRPDVPRHHLLRWDAPGGKAPRFGRVQWSGFDRQSPCAHSFAQCVL